MPILGASFALYLAMQIIGVILFVACILGSFVGWAVVVYNMFRAVALRKPGVSMWHGTWFNPFNLLLQPDKLSVAGLVSRNRCVFGTIVFLTCSLLGVAVHIMFGLGT